MRQCEMCHKRLETPSLQDEIEAQLEYRENFPFTGAPDDMILVCDDCFEKMKDEEDPQDWDKSHAF